MKNYISIVMLIFAGVTFTQAQRMIPKQKGIEVNVGTLSYENPGRNYYLNIGMTIHGKNGNYQLFALEYTHEYYKYKNLRIPHETYMAEGGYSFCLLSDSRKNITLNAALSAVAGYETINRGEQILYDGARILNKEDFIYGAGGRLSLETYLSDRFVFLIQGRTKVLWGTDLEQFRPSAGLGLRINL